MGCFLMRQYFRKTSMLVETRQVKNPEAFFVMKNCLFNEAVYDTMLKPDRLKIQRNVV